MNKYSKLFNDNMSSNELQGVLFTVAGEIPQGERDELFKAYEPFMSKAVSREIDYAFKNHCLMV